MTFIGLVLTLSLGYLAGVIIGPVLRRGKSSWGDVCVASGIAGGLASSAPYVLLHSVWIQELITDPTFPGGIAVAIVWLAEHILVACFTCSAIAIIATALLLKPAQRRDSDAEMKSELPILGPNILWRSKNTIWLLLCLPAVAFSLWHRLSRQPITGTESTYFLAGFFFVGLLGYVISSAFKALRQK